jgi:hypothetical protein
MGQQGNSSLVALSLVILIPNHYFFPQVDGMIDMGMSRAVEQMIIPMSDITFTV